MNPISYEALKALPRTMSRKEWGSWYRENRVDKWFTLEWQNQEPWEPLTGMTIAQMLMAKEKGNFKAFAARRINGKVAKPKRFKVPIPARKSIWSVLGPYTTGRQMKNYHAETLMLKKVSRTEFVSENPWEGETMPQGYGPWPPKNWTPGLPAPHEGEGRWIKALFASKCSDCATEIQANVRAFYYRECRAILCQDCGSRAAQRRAA